jgi:hypothetical protein
MNKLSLHIYFTVKQYDALVPFRNNPQKVIPEHVIINMSL